MKQKVRNKMNFELGKEYIVKVSEEGIIPIEEFNKSRWYDKDHDDLDFLTDGEKILVTNQVLDKIRADIEAIIGEYNYNLDDYDFCSGLICARKIIDNYKAGE